MPVLYAANMTDTLRRAGLHRSKAWAARLKKEAALAKHTR